MACSCWRCAEREGALSQRRCESKQQRSFTPPAILPRQAALSERKRLRSWSVQRGHWTGLAGGGRAPGGVFREPVGRLPDDVSGSTTSARNSVLADNPQEPGLGTR